MKMNKKAGSFRQNIRQAFAAFSYEHSGEMLSVKGKSQVLSGASRNYSVKGVDRLSSDVQSSSRRILLTIDKSFDPEILKYTIDAAKQFNASIDIFSRQSHEEINKIMKNEENGSAVSWRLLKLENELLSDLSGYTNNDTDVLFIVTDQHKILSGFSGKSQNAA